MFWADDWNYFVCVLAFLFCFDQHPQTDCGDLYGAIDQKQMTAMRLELLTKMEAIIMELEARYTEFKALVYRFEQSCDALSRINRNDYRYALSTLLDSEYLLKEVLLSLGQDLQCKKDVFKGLKDLSLNPQAFNAATHEHLTLYLGIWSEMPYIDMRKFRLAEVALLAEI
mmetsp:Transcript_1482/g.2591  ORF Transcript_1482/g.2591 Transcript_1482/m.2591 type:complete len:170 (+) Transcript_1482:638-1147(+)